MFAATTDSSEAYLSVEILVGSDVQRCLCHILVATRAASGDALFLTVVWRNLHSRLILVIGLPNYIVYVSQDGMMSEPWLLPVISLGNIPGAMLLTRTFTPGRRSSCARRVLRWIVAALDTLYLKWCCVVRVMPDMDEILMTDAVRPSRAAAESRGRKAAVVKKYLDICVSELCMKRQYTYTRFTQ